LVDPDGVAVEVYRLSGERFVLARTARGDEPITSALLPDLHLRPSELLPIASH
jgi:hypothetical protein